MNLQRLRKYALPGAAMLAAALAMSVAAGPASALVEVNVTGGKVQPLPIAIPVFKGNGQDGQLGSDIAGVVSADLKRSGLFVPIDPSTFTQANISADTTPSFADWTAISAQALVAGSVATQADGRVKAEFRLWDTFAGQQMDGQQFFTSPANWRRLAHIIADAVYTRLTGEKGYFDSRVVFVDETGPKDNRVRRLAIMDQDGANVRYLTDGKYMELTPRFSPSSQEITYMSYDYDQPRVYLLNIDTGQREPVGDFPGMTSAPRFSPDGQKVIMSLSTGHDTNLFTLDLKSRRTTRLTDDAAIDTAASYSPDGSQIVFESDRGGTTQLYVMNANGSNPHRITFGQGEYDTPVWSPRGDLIAFTRRANGLFAVGVIKPDGSGQRILTEGFHNEGPTWAPNGRVLMFFRNTQGSNGGPQLWSIDLSGYGESQVPTPHFASDPAWSPLLN